MKGASDHTKENPLTVKAPYERPEVKRAGKLRDVTAQKTGVDD
jgi:hypothetical protein